MKLRTPMSRRAAFAGAVLLLVTATSCGTLPTAPNGVDATSSGPIAHHAAQTLEASPPMDLPENMGGGGGGEPKAPDVIIITYNPGGQHRGWEHRKHPK
jgi:hypothetical protein